MEEKNFGDLLGLMDSIEREYEEDNMVGVETDWESIKKFANNDIEYNATGIHRQLAKAILELRGKLKS